MSSEIGQNALNSTSPGFLRTVDRCRACDAEIVRYQNTRKPLTLATLCCDCLARQWNPKQRRWRK